MTSGRLILRATVGGLLVGHGLQKLNGSFDGPGLEGTEKMMGSIGMHPARQQALAAALSETVGGGLTLAGLFSPLGPAMILGSMVVAIQKVHGKNGVWITKGGYEYNAVLIAASAALAGSGPGPLSLDGLLGRQRQGIAWLLAGAGLGVGAAAGALAISDRSAPDDAATGGAAPADTGTSAVTAAAEGSPTSPDSAADTPVAAD